MRIDPPSAAQLRSFLKAVEVGTFIRAAHELGISQPSLSRHIKSLEDHLGVRLFDRDTRKVVLSAAGAELLPICQRMLSELDGGTAEMADVAAGRRGRIAIAALPSMASALLPGALPRLRAVNPGIDVRFVDGTQEDVETAVIQGHADFGLTTEPVRKEYLRFRHLMDDPMLALLEPHDPDEARTELSWAELAKKPFIAIKTLTSIRRMTDLGFAKAGVVVSPAFEVAYVKTAATLVAAGLGATAIPRLYLPECVDLCTTAVSLLHPSINRRVGVVTAVHRTISPTARLLIDRLVEVASTMNQTDGHSGVMPR